MAAATVVPEPPKVIFTVKDKQLTPKKFSSRAAGYDLSVHKTTTILPGETQYVGTGVNICIENDYYGRVTTRSSFKKNMGLHLSDGTVDADYRGEIKLIITNPTNEVIHLPEFTRAAQIIFHPMTNAEVIYFDGSSSRAYNNPLLATKRGSGGFGSTGGYLARSSLSIGREGKMKDDGEKSEREC